MSEYPDNQPETLDPFPQSGDGIPDEEEPLEEEENDRPVTTPARPRYRGATSDPVFGYLLALALSVGLIPLIGNGNADLRFTICWLALAAVGVLAWLMGNGERIGEEIPENLIWGIVFGLIVGAPFYAFGGATLGSAVKQIFAGMRPGTVLAYLIFVMPLAETLFFRGVLQQGREFWEVGLWSSFWSILLFFPLLNLGEYPAVAFVIAVALVIINMIYSYVRYRNGLAAAWLCQITINIVMIFLPFL